MFNGDFSAQSATALIYNPYSYNAATQTRAPFAGNIVPTSLLNPLSKALLAYYLPKRITLWFRRKRPISPVTRYRRLMTTSSPFASIRRFSSARVFTSTTRMKIHP